MKVEDARKSVVRGALLKFVEQNEVCICDTVMYELLRNLNAKRFRERHALVRRAGLECLAEDDAVRSMFERINWLYLSALQKEPWKYLHRNQNDLWIIAAGLANGVQSFLTTDSSSDFLSDFFSTDIFCLDKERSDCNICLHDFHDELAEKRWKLLEKEEGCTAALAKGYLKKLESESWKKYGAKPTKAKKVPHVLPLFG